MARMIPQRKSPPYLLIIMVFLFLVSTGLAVKLYMDREEAEKKTVRAEKIFQTLASKKDMVLQHGQYVESVEQDKDITDKGYSLEELCTMFRKKAADNNTPDMTVVSRLKGDVGSLSRLIVGRMASRREAAERVAEFGKVFSDDMGRDMGGLVDELKTLKDRVIALGGKDGAGGEIAVLQKEKIAIKEEIETHKGEIVKLKAVHTDQLSAKSKEIETLDANFKKELADISTQLATERADHEKQRQQLSTEVQKHETTIADLNMKIRTSKAKESVLGAEITQLKEKIAILERRRDEGTRLVRKITPDGAVMSDPDRSGYCYINIGSKDGVRRNWTFAVYAPGPISEQTNPKGAVVVTRVLPDVSECRLTKDVGGAVATIVKGDLIANLAYDKSRTYTFVVEGVFDLHGTGRATLAGAAAVKTLIRNYGGKIADEVIVNTDYVVLGEEMPKPVEPGADAPPQVRKAYEDNLTIWKRYNDVKSKAIGLRIPVLNSNRFLDYIGQMPEKRLEYND